MEKLNFLDLHFHIDPDLHVRRHSILTLGPLLQKLRGAVFAKSHLGSTVAVASIAQKLGYPIHGSIALNRSLGPLHYSTLLSALAARDPDERVATLVYLPTIKSHAKPGRLMRKSRHAFTSLINLESEPLLSNGRLKNEVIDILRMAKDYPIRLASGHSHRDELMAILDVAGDLGLESFLITHPAHPCLGLQTKELLSIANLYPFAWFEQTALTYHLGYQDRAALQDILNRVPRLIYSSDFGQPNCPDVDQWVSDTEKLFHELDLNSEKQTELLVENAKNFIGL